MTSRHEFERFPFTVLRLAFVAFLAGTLLAATQPTLAGAQDCVGDCNGDEEVTINELIIGVNIALGNATVDDCPAFDTNDDGEVTINELIAAVNNALSGCGEITPPTEGPTATPTETPGGGNPLGERAFSIAAVDFGNPLTRTGLFSSGVVGGNVLLRLGELDGTPMEITLRLLAGAPDPVTGIAPLSLVEDVLFIAKPLLDVMCLKWYAEGSTGELYCNGSPDQGVDFAVQQETGDGAPPAVTTGPTGDSAPAGAAYLQFTFQLVQLPEGSDDADCLTAEYDPPETGALTTGVVSVTKGSAAQDKEGEPFDCENWTTEDGAGMLVQGFTLFDARAGGDTANTLRIADSQ